MKDVVNIIKKYYIYFILVVVLILLSVIFLSNRNIELKKYHNDNYSFKYASTWHITKNKREETSLKSAKANLNIKLITLADEYKYSNIDDILENIIYELNNQNNNYKLISQKDTKLTKEDYSGYKLLYESKDKQAMVNIIKNGERVILFIYESPNKYFDILLDSVQNIIYNFKLEPVKYNFKTKIQIDDKKINFSKNQELVNKIKDTNVYEIASNNYYIKYSLPSILKRSTLDTTLGQFNYLEDKKEIRVVTNILKTNIYNYLDTNQKGLTIYTNYNYIKENKSKDYSNYKEQLSEIKIGDYNGYIYKVSYTMKLYLESNFEDYNLIIPINKNHLFLIRITGKNVNIPKEFIDSIKINSTKHYASYIKRDINNGYLNVDLKRFIDYKSKNYETVKIIIPEKYEEIDNNTNMYEYRYFGLNHDEKNDVYQYNITYKAVPDLKKDSIISLANSAMHAYKNNPNYKEYSYLKEMTIEDRKYEVYEAGYTKNGVLYNTSKAVDYYVNNMLMFTELDNGDFFTIEISGNNTSIDDKMILELANIEVTMNEYK